MASKPARNGAFWTREEEHEILAFIKAGLPIRTIAERKERTTGGIRSRLTQIACRFVEVDKMSLYEAAGRTGVPPNQIEEAIRWKTEQSKAKATPPTGPMKFPNTFSRSELQSIPAKRRLEAIRNCVDNCVGYSVEHAAASGKTSHLVVLPTAVAAIPAIPAGKPYTQPYQPTPDDIVEGLKAKFPGCDVTFAEEWVDVRPGVREHRSGILIDWS